jgi:hypothetical protein
MPMLQNMKALIKLLRYKKRGSKAVPGESYFLIEINSTTGAFQITI